VPIIDNLTRRLAKLSRDLSATSLDFQTFYVVCVLLYRYRPEAEMMTVEKNPTLRRKSMELLKELTQILQEIIGSGDEESLRRLEETIRTIDESRRKPGRTLHCTALLLMYEFLLLAVIIFYVAICY
jgi:hypothetical protein